MASKVNTRFVIILVVGVIALLGLLFLAYSIAYKSPSELAKAGDSMMASGDYKQAERLYSKAVNKDLSNTENMEKWVDSLEHILPETETEYQTRFKTDYIGAIKMIATVKRNDIAAHDRYLSLRYKMLKSGYNRGWADQLVDETTGALAFFNEDPDKVGEWERLKRYRGLTINMIAQAPNSVLEDEKYLLAQDDLERALLADPDDTEVALGLMSITKLNLLREIPEHDKRAQIQAIEQSLEIGRSYLESHPDDLAMQMQMLLQDAELANRRIQLEKDGKERIEAQYASLAGYADQVDAIAEKLLGLSADQLTLSLIQRFYSLENAIKPDDNLSITRKMIDRMIASKKDDAELLLIAGQIAQAAGDPEEALGWYSQIADIATKPLSYEGSRLYNIQKAALRLQAMIRVDGALEVAAKKDTESGDLEAAIELAKQSRDAYAQSVSEDDLSLMLIDGKIALAKDENQHALGLFKKFNELTLRENADGLWAEALTARRLNQLGVARDALVEMIPREKTSRKFLAMLNLAAIDEQLDEYESAAKLYKDILAVNPDYAPAVEGLDGVEKMINPELNDDPVLAVLFKARQIRKGTAQTPGDLGAAIQYLKDHIEEFNYDPIIARELASILFDRGEINETIAVLSKSLELNPDHEDSEMFKKTLSALDPNDLVGSRIAMLRQAEGDELSRQLAIAQIAYENNRPELLNETITKLVSMAPNDPGVIEIQFITAIRDGDVEKAKKLIAEQSLNPLMNLSYSARIAVAEGNTDKAIQLLEQAAASGTADASVYQMLATLKRQAGDLPAAIEAYEQSLAITPDNPTVIGDYVLALTQAGQYEEALSTARRLQQYGMSNTTFLNLWLNLEAIYGGENGQKIAIEQRKRLYELDPDNVENAGQLARMYIMSKDWDASKAIIDELRAKHDSLALVELEAGWNADQGMVNGRNGLVIANELFASYIDSLEPPVGDQPYIANAEFMLNRGRPDLAVVAANEAIKRQDPKTMLGTKLLGDLYARINNLSKAVAAYQEVIDGGADPDFSIHMKQINTLTRLGRYEEAQALFADLPESMTTKMETMILASDIALGLGDHAKASKILDDIVAQYPSNSYAFVKRAQSMVNDETLLNDVLADIDRAIELNPNDWRAYRVRAVAYFNAGRSEDALKDLRTTIRMNPSLNKSIFAILNELLDQPGGASEAIEVAREVANSRPDDAAMMAKMAGLFAAKEEWEKASELYGMAWNKRHGVNDGAIYIDSLVRQTPPDAQTATTVINEVAKMVGDINKSAGLLAAQALVLQARGRDDFAKQQLSKAFDLSTQSDADIVGWSGNLSRYFEGQPMNDQIEFLETLKRRNSSATVHQWLDMFIAQRMAREDQVPPRCYEILASLTEDAANPTIRLRAFKLYGSVLYEHKQYEEAAKVWTDGLDVFSDDWEMNNNLAYVLSKELGENEKALEYGQKAIDKNIARSEAYETMAGIYLRLGKYDEAEQMIETGSNYIRTIPARISMLVTTGRLHLARNELLEARSSLTDAQSILRSASTAYPSLKEEIDSLEQEIDSAEE